MHIDEEVADAIARKDPLLIWAMVATLAAMDEPTYQVNRAAIKEAKIGVDITALDRARRKPAKDETRTGWRALLDGDPPVPNVRNCLLALRHAPELAGCVRFNEMIRRPVVSAKLPWGTLPGTIWREVDDIYMAEWLQARGLNVTERVVQAATTVYADEHRYDPCRDYLRGLEWDGDRRLDTWLTDYMGVESSSYVAAVGRRWMISGVARIMRPGCKADHMLILEGLQGIGKSTMFDVLAGEWFSDTPLKLGDKDAQAMTTEKWIIEWGELDALSKSEFTEVLSFITRRTEDFRTPYGRRNENHKRRCIFGGTSNGDKHFDRDEGLRRFWPVRCGRTDIPGLTAARDQLWAEAVAAYDAGENWWITDEAIMELARAEQVDRIRDEPWIDKIQALTAVVQEATVPEVLERLNIPTGEWKRHMTSVANCLKALGFVKQVSRREGRPSRVWRRD